MASPSTRLTDPAGAIVALLRDAKMQLLVESPHPAATPDTAASVLSRAGWTAVVLAILVGGCGPRDPCGPNPNQEAIVSITMASDGGYVAGDDAGAVDGGLDDLVARCQASPSDCIPLCERLLPGYWQFTSCRIVSIDGGLAVQADYMFRCLG